MNNLDILKRLSLDNDANILIEKRGGGFEKLVTVPQGSSALAVKTSPDGGVGKLLGSGSVLPGRDTSLGSTLSGLAAFNSSEQGRSARRSGSVAVRWTDGTLTKISSGSGEAMSLETIDGEAWVKVTPSTTASSAIIIRFDLAKPVYFGYFKSIQIPLKYQDMSPTEIASAKFTLWLYTSTGTVRVNAIFDKQWPNELVVESFCQDGYVNVAQPVTDLNLDQVSRIDIVTTSGTSSAAKAPFRVGPLTVNVRGKGKVIVRMDGNYDSQHKYLLPLLERQGLRANLHLVTNQVGQAGRMTEAQLGRAYDWGHTLAHHTFGNKSNGWDNVTDYPDGASIAADINAQWAYLNARGWTRGVGHAVHGFTNTLVNTVSNARQLLVQSAVNAAGVKTISSGGHYLANGTAGEVGHLFPYCHPMANWRGIFGGVMVTNTDTAQYVKNVIDAAEDRGELAVIVVHRAVLDSATPAALEMKLADMANWIEYLGDRVLAGGVDVPTIDEVYEQFGH